MNDIEKHAMADIVRASLKAALAGKRFVPENPGLPALEAHCGCFVTLKTRHRLRGCLGCFTADQPLWQTVAEYARHSAREDPRFLGNQLQADEYPDIDIEVSVLSPLQPCPNPEAIRLGVDGIYVRERRASGCFLPQVATETGWDVEEFWGHCCRDKAGLAWDAWREPGKTGVELFTFTAEIVPINNEQ